MKENSMYSYHDIINLFQWVIPHHFRWHVNFVGKTIYIYIYIYVYVLFGPVKPELEVIPSGQKTIQQWTFRFSWY